MKFRGMMNDPAAMRDFMNICLSLSKIAKDCVMRIMRSKVYFIVSDEDSGVRKPLVWCELPVNYYFKEYTLAGFSEEYDEIYLEFATAMLARTLTTLKQNAKSLKIKLTNKQCPCITLEIDLNTGEGMLGRQCIHDIPVEVISQRHWSNYAEPQFNDFHVSIQMPNLKSVKNIVDRMKNMSHTLIVSANKSGRLALKIKTNIVSLSAHFTDLNVESFAVGQIPTIGNLESSDDENDTVSTTIDIKKFLMFLNGMLMNNYRTTCSIVQGKMVKLFMEQPGALSLQIFLTEIST